MWRAGLAWLSFLLLGAGCPQTAVAPPHPPGPGLPVDPKDTEVTACPAQEPFATLSWVPPSAEAVTLVDLRADTLREALAQLADGANSPDRKLPIRMAFALGQWTWQVPLLRTTLEQAGFDPSQLVHISLPSGASAWAWPPSCDLPTLTENLERGWGLSLRATPFGAVASASTAHDGAPAFAYDFIAFGASAYALVPAGRAHTVAQHLGERSLDTSQPSLGDTAAGIEDAPLRLVIRTGALLTPGADPSADDRVTRHRVTREGWSFVQPDA